MKIKKEKEEDDKEIQFYQFVQREKKMREINLKIKKLHCKSIRKATTAYL